MAERVEARAAGLLDDAWAAYGNDHYQQALAAAAQVVVTAEQLDNPVLLVRALQVEAAVLQTTGDHAAALARYTRILALADDPASRGRLHHPAAAEAVAIAYWKWVDCAQSVTATPERGLLLQVLDAAEQWLAATGHRDWRAAILSERASIYGSLGELDAALSAAEEALAVKEQHPEAPGYTLNTHRLRLGDILLQARRAPEAVPFYQAILADPAASPRDRHVAHQGLAQCALLVGDTAAARRNAHAAVQLAEPLGDDALGTSLGLLAEASRADGDLDAAWQAAIRYLDAAGRVGGHLRPYYAVREAADIALDREDLAAVDQLLGELYEHATALDTTTGTTTYTGETARRHQRLAALTARRLRSDYAPPREPVRPDIAPPGEPHQHWLLADMPTTAPLHADVSLLVRIGTHSSGAVGGSALLKAFETTPGGTRVAIIVQAPRALSPTEALEQVIVVPEDGDSERVRFAFRAEQTGLFTLRVMAYAGGTFLGELVAELSVEAAGLLTDGPTRTAAMAPVRVDPGEVTLQVRFDGEQYTFQLLSDSCLFEPVLARALTARPGVAVERAMATLRAMANASSGYTPKNARIWMEQTGIGLWNDMVPDLIKEQFWQLRSSIGAFSIACGQDTIPWELLYPLSPADDEGFLVEQFPVVRRVYGQRRCRWVSISPPLYVVPTASPANAEDEVARLRRSLPAGTEIISNLERLLGLIDAGAIGLLHFACHNTFRTDSGGSSIMMGGGPFVPELLNRAVTTQALAERSPLVFINACRSAGAIPEYTRLMGWAGQFMAAGAGAFVGTLWAVRSASALAFAESFYDALLAGHALGKAALMARHTTAADASDPTWLAYTIYGNPAATAANPGDHVSGATNADH